MDPDTYRKKIEFDIINIIVTKLKNGSMEAERAQEIAQMVLKKLHPPLTLEQIYNIVPTLDDHFQELAAAVNPVVRDQKESVEKIVSQNAMKLIKTGKFKDATLLINQAIN